MRTSGPNAGKVQVREADLREGKRITEIKDGKDAINDEQYNAYVDQMTKRAGHDGDEVNELVYVFTNVEGAKANLAKMAQRMQLFPKHATLVLEVFDQSGTRHRVATPLRAFELLAQLRNVR